MNISLTLIQVLFSLVCILFTVTFSTHYFEGGFHWINASVGVLGGCVLAAILYGVGRIFRKYNLRTFNTTALGLLFGYVMAEAILFSIKGIIGLEANNPEYMPLRFALFLVTAYIGVMMTVRAAEEIRISIPFVEFKQMNHKKKDILVDLSILADPRIIDLASTGLLDHQLIIPRFSIRELYATAESGDELSKARAKRGLEIIKKLESLPALDLRYVDTDFPEIQDSMTKLIRLARFMDTHIITSDINRIQQATEGVRIINIHMLSNALKPITQAGEAISIKIQRYGKEARQGVGYLEDGTMVVVNGGAEFIGETIKAFVLSVKHTSSGRMIFCNAAEEDCFLLGRDSEPNIQELEDQKTFLAL